MLELHLSTCDFIIPFYQRMSRYAEVSASLLRSGAFCYDEALARSRLELYGLHNQVQKLLDMVCRRLRRFDNQVQESLMVGFLLWHLLASLITCLEPYTVVHGFLGIT